VVYSCKVNVFFTIMMLSFDFIQALMSAAIPLAAYVKHLNIFFSLFITPGLVTNFVLVVFLLLSVHLFNM
jgi:hypothetical protein